MRRLIAAAFGHGGSVAPSGTLSLRVIKPWPSVLRDERHISLRVVATHTLPWFGHAREVNLWRLRNLRHVYRGLWRVLIAEVFGIQTHFGVLWLTRIDEFGNRTPFGLASLRVVTTTGAGFIVDAFQNIVELENMKFHGFGTGGAAEAVGNTALTTELTTEYAVNSTRPTGSQTEASATVYRTVGTLSPDASVAITEHGIFDQAATGGGVLLDRTLFSVVNLVGSADSLQATYDFTVTAGS